MYVGCFAEESQNYIFLQSCNRHKLFLIINVEKYIFTRVLYINNYDGKIFHISDL